ncbi:MAG: energy transducer TonB [Terracidiphilus sp.]
MHKNPSQFTSCGFRRAGIRLLQVAALALVAGTAMHANAAENRATKSRVAPVYPEMAKRLKISGIVVIEATVDPEGKVGDVKTISGNRLLAPAAEDAVRKWKFVAAPAKSTESVEINFTGVQ